MLLLTYLIICCLFNELEYFFHGPWNNTLVLRSTDHFSHLLLIHRSVTEAFHSVGFTSTCLAICKYRGIVTLQNREHCRLGCVIINVLLSGVWTIHMVEREIVIVAHARIPLYILLPCSLRGLCAKILLHADRFAALRNFANWFKSFILAL